MRERVRTARVARLATIDSDGRPHLVPIAAGCYCDDANRGTTPSHTTAGDTCFAGSTRRALSRVWCTSKTSRGESSQPCCSKR
jgi:Pyridoxamine 5'-phosphate oxidase